MRTRIKICGVTHVDDALLAAEAGADAIGLIQVPGARRRISLETAAEIAAALPAYVTPVLVFADASVDEMNAAIRMTGVRTVQLHGHEPVAVALELQRVSVIKRLEVGAALKSELEHWSLLNRSALSGILLEGPGRGGAGIPTDLFALDWTLSTLDRSALPPLVLAGGLMPETVTEAVRRLRPYGVDVSSGVENPAVERRKDPHRLRAFVDAVRAADQAVDTAG